MDQPIELYFWPTPNGLKIIIMLEECELPYKLCPIDISRGEQFKSDFLKISPNNKIPAIVDLDGPGRKAISIFESGAILLYLARKTRKFLPQNENDRCEVERWLMWQMASFGPMLGQNHHFRHYAPEKIPYAMTRYTNETKRLYGVLDRRLSEHDFVAGEYSIADMAILPWANSWDKQGVKLDEFVHVKTWYDNCMTRPALKKGMQIGQELRSGADMKDPKVQAVLFSNRR